MKTIISIPVWDIGLIIGGSYYIYTLNFKIKISYTLTFSETKKQEPTTQVNNQSKLINWLSANQGPVFPDSDDSC